MKSLIYPSDHFKDECMAAIAARSPVTVKVLPGPKLAPMSRLLARITRAPKQPSLLVGVIDNIRIVDFMVSIAKAGRDDWTFSYTSNDQGLTILIEPPR